MRAIGVIPARYESTRFRGKPLAEILGKPMICWVVEGASKADLLDEVIVATDDQRIYDTVSDYGYKAVMTASAHQSGSDRIWEVASKMDVDIVVNIQGDEPTISGEIIDSCIRPFQQFEQADVTTLKIPLSDRERIINPNQVKVVCDAAGFALYFSRAAIPYLNAGEITGSEKLHYGHVGIYAYRKKALEKFCQLPVSHLEKAESLEQLRGLAAGMKYYVVESSYQSLDVNTEADINKVEEFLTRTGGKQ